MTSPLTRQQFILLGASICGSQCVDSHCLADDNAAPLIGFQSDDQRAICITGDGEKRIKRWKACVGTTCTAEGVSLISQKGFKDEVLIRHTSVFATWNGKPPENGVLVRASGILQEIESGSDDPLVQSAGRLRAYVLVGATWELIPRVLHFDLHFDVRGVEARQEEGAEKE